MKTAGYSVTPLSKKLGIKTGFKVKTVNAPDYYLKLFSDFPEGVEFYSDKKTKKNFIHLFAKSVNEFEKNFPLLKNEITFDGMIWVSWYKKSSGIKTDLNEKIIRDTGLKLGLVDIKVCAVDDFWSALKFVIPVKNR
ncbi:MAG TPA: DUF3052 domain-containing protein [Bacteroidetes bacterium]|nr:DUF3052 domain-containing protein [Bacteroidota bacterium]